MGNISVDAALQYIWLRSISLPPAPPQARHAHACGLVLPQRDD